jgi:hypothetical protein
MKRTPIARPGLSDDQKQRIVKQLERERALNVGRTIARIVRHVDPPPAVLRERTRLENNFPNWLRFHGGEAFSSPWSADHEKILQRVEKATNAGGLFTLAMPRGHGKSTIIKWTAIYALLTGRRKYVVVVAATADLAQGIVDFVRQQIMESNTLHRHYPHVTEYARATGGKGLKARYQLRADMKTSGIHWSKSTLVLPEVTNEGQVLANGSKVDGKHAELYPAAGAILEAHGLTGAIRGKWRDSRTGRVWRPDFAIIDDPQTRESAESVAQSGQRERIVTGDVLGLAGHNRRIAAVMPVTVIQNGDFASRFLDHELHPEWQGIITKLVNVWPTAQKTLWAKYAEIYRREASEGRGLECATAFYLEHRAAMDAGAQVAWEYRVRDGEISALQTAENLLLEMGTQFWAEMQNEPQRFDSSVYSLDAKQVQQHVGKLPRLVVSDQARILVAGCDINRAGLHWVVASFTQNMTGQVVAYGRWPESGDVWQENAPEGERKSALYLALVNLGKYLQALPFTRFGKRVSPSRLLVDRGFEPETVQAFCAQSSFRFKVLAARGYAGHKYMVRKQTLVGAPFEQAHMTEASSGQFIAWNADYWREVMQRAWLGEVGTPGGIVLYTSDMRDHVQFSNHITAERLRQKYQTDAGVRWEWTWLGGTDRRQPNDWADALNECYVAAASLGLTSQGTKIATKQRRREIRKCKVLPT